MVLGCHANALLNRWGDNPGSNLAQSLARGMKSLSCGPRFYAPVAQCRDYPSRCRERAAPNNLGNSLDVRHGGHPGTNSPR